MILQSILLLICANIVECCTQLTNNELIIVSKVNETIQLNIRDLFIKDDISQLILSQDGSNLFLRNQMFIHSKVNNSFEQIIKAKVLRSNHDFSSLNQYILLNQHNNKLELYYSDKQFFGSKARLPNFTQKIEIEKYKCHDFDFIQQGTIILDCYEGDNNFFLIYSIEYGIQIFQDDGEYFNPQIKRQINHLQNNLIMRVVFYQEQEQKSTIQIYQFQTKDERKFVLIMTIDEEYLQAFLDEPNLSLSIIQLEVQGTNFSILNQDQWFGQFDLSAFPKLESNLFLRLKYSENIVSFALHNSANILTFQSLNHLYTIYNKTESNKTIDNLNNSNKIYYSKNFFILQQQQKISMYNLQLKYMESINIDISFLILDQFEDEIIILNKDFSGRIMLNINKYLVVKSKEIIQNYTYATLQQQLSFIDYCTLNIKLITISQNSTKMIPIKMNQLDLVLNNQIESFQLPIFIAGPNISFKDVTQQKQNGVTFSINFEQMILKNIGIFQEGTAVFSRAFQMNFLLLYLVQLSNRDLYFYYCSLQLSCNIMNNTKFDFDLSQTEHQSFVMNTYFSYFVVKNNQQLDVYFLLYSSQIEYQCTIYPDQDETITHFVYINQKIAVLQSNDQLIFYSIECVKQHKITQDFFKQDQIEWHPSYIHSNQDLKLLLIKSMDQIIVIKVNELFSSFIDIIQLSSNSQIEIFSSPKTFWIYYLNTTIIDSYNWESIVNIYFLTKVSLYDLVPNKFVNHPQSQYIYLYRDSDISRKVYAYDMYANSHNSLITTILNIKGNVFCSILNYFIIGDSNTYYQMPNGISFSIIYKDILNSSQVIRVNSSIQIEGIDKQEKIQYPIFSGLVNPYTTILIDNNQLNLTGLVNQRRPVGSCQEKYSWYSGQVTDIGLKSQQLQLIKPLHLYNTNVTMAGLDMKLLYNQTFLILNKNSLVRFDYATQTQIIQDLNLNYTYPQILLIQNELIFVNCYKNNSYTINIVQCTIQFNCSQITDIITPFVIKSIKFYNDFYFFIGLSTINIYSKQAFKFNLIGKILANNQGGFYDISSLQDNFYQIYLIKDNILKINLYQIQQTKITLIQTQSIDLLETLRQQGIFVNAQTTFVKVLIKQMLKQQEVYSSELFLQSYSHSHYILWLIQICKLTDSISCIINKIKVLQILQSYGGWNSNKVEIYNQQYILMAYQQGQTYLDVIYRIELEYFITDLNSSLFIGAVQHNFVNNQQAVFFIQNQQTLLLTNINEYSVYSLYQINNTTKFCITNNIVHESVKIALKNNFDQVESIIEIKTSDDDTVNKLSVGWLMFWIILGFIILFGIGALLLCCFRYGKKQEQLITKI